ncbi:MAG: tetratricopeptide repeat protein, partial [Deltaproteobacteria bacterium]|nr:tetratricopeptide repeat protein [Deltaproteobacteria bacterium]
WGGLGRAFEGERNLAAAAEAYEAGLALDPNDAALLRSAAITRSKLGEYGRAMELLARAIELEPKNPLNQQMLERTLRKIERSAE